MKNLIGILCLPLCMALAAKDSYAQRFRLNASAVYVSDEVVYASPDPMNTGSLNRIKGGFKPGLGLEYRPSGKSSYELLYFGQRTHIEDWHYAQGNTTLRTNLRADFNHVLFSSLRYFNRLGNTEPFAGLMGGVGITSFQNPLNGVSNTRPAFSWGLRSGMNMGGNGIMNARVFANLLWTMKSIGGNFSTTAAAPPAHNVRYASMIQLQLGASISLHRRRESDPTPRVEEVRKPLMKVPKELSSEALYFSRTNKVFREITLSGDTLVLRLFDNAVVDNDTVTLFLNGYKFITRRALRADPELFVFPIKEMFDTTDFVMLAESMGEIPPNTAMLRANYDNKEQYVLMESTDTTSAMIRLINPGGKPRTQMDLATLEKARVRDSTERMQRLMAIMDNHASEIKARIPNAEVTRKETQVNILFSTGMMFQRNSFEIGEPYKRDLATLKAMYMKFPDSRIRIEGHTDDTGPDVLNSALSRKRAEAVFEYLKILGIPAARMDIAGFGESKPKYPNDTEENRKKNRRVEIVITPNL